MSRKTESVLFVLFCEYLWLYIKYSKLFSILYNCLVKSLSFVIEHRSLFLLWLSKEVSFLCDWAKKSLSCVIEHRSLLELSLSIEKSLTCGFEQLVIRYYILVELSLEVQRGQNYFRFVEGTCIIACVLSFSVLLLLSAALRLWTQVRLWTISDSKSGNSFSERRKEKFLKTPPSCGFSHLQKKLINHLNPITLFDFHHCW